MTDFQKRSHFGNFRILKVFNFKKRFHSGFKQTAVILCCFVNSHRVWVQPAQSKEVTLIGIGFKKKCFFMDRNINISNVKNIVIQSMAHDEMSIYNLQPKEILERLGIIGF